MTDTTTTDKPDADPPVNVFVLGPGVIEEALAKGLSELHRKYDSAVLRDREATRKALGEARGLLCETRFRAYLTFPQFLNRRPGESSNDRS